MSARSYSLSLRGKTILVTGATSGLGAHFAKVLAGAGARTILAGRRKDRLTDTVDALSKSGYTATAIEMDVTSAASVDAGIEKAVKVYGPIDVLVNNAGVAKSSKALALDEASWDLTLDTNLKGVWRVATAIARQMLENDVSGSIINIASILGLRVGLGQSAYATSKAGVIHLTKSLALEFARKKIRVNAICPGYFLTELNSDYFATDHGKNFIAGTPAGRLGSLEELDGIILLLASDQSSFINGSIIPVDGGHLVSPL